MLSHAVSYARPPCGQCVVHGFRYNFRRAAVHLARVSATRKSSEHLAIFRGALRRQLGDRGFNIAESLVDGRRLYRARLHGADVNFEGPQLEAQGIAQQSECGLAGVEQAPERDRDVRADGSDVDDSPAVAADRWKKRLGDYDLAEHVDVKDLL